MAIETLQAADDFLSAHADKAYADFCDKLEPAPLTRFGVRMPILRILSRQVLAGSDPAAFCRRLLVHARAADDPPLEWIQLLSLTVPRLKNDPTLRPAFFAAMLPLMNSWESCDLMGNEARYMGPAEPGALKELTRIFNLHLVPKEGSIWALRVVLVVLMRHYRALPGRETALTFFADPRLKPLSEAFYYLRMAQAWGWTTFLSVDYDAVLPAFEAALSNERLSEAAARLTVSKVRQSRCFEAGQKAAVAARVLQHFK